MHRKLLGPATGEPRNDKLENPVPRVRVGLFSRDGSREALVDLGIRDVDNLRGRNERSGVISDPIPCPP